MTRSFTPRRHMTRWLDLAEGAASVVSMLRSRKADLSRDTLTPPRGPTASFRDEPGDLWFDYVADLGDAFDPTMAVAWYLGRNSVTIAPHRLGEWPAPPDDGLPRGRLLVFGGDQIYPYASRRRYGDQLLGPYEAAWEAGGAEAMTCALPGNHDWYGGLGPFREVFMEGQRVGQRSTSQTATWFAAELGRGWWVWGIDTGLEGSINATQRAYFEQVAAKLAADARIVLCTGVPLWALDAKRPAELEEIDRFVDEVIGTRASVPLYLSGDRHVFAAWRRRTPSRTDVHVTSGGGGAFLHPTHHLPANRGASDRARFHLRTCWPDGFTSEHLAAPWWVLMRDRQSRLLVPAVGAVLYLHACLVWWSCHLSGARQVVEDDGLVRGVLCAPGGWALLAVLGFGITRALAPNSASPTVRRAARRFGLVTAIPLSLVVLGTTFAMTALADAVRGRPQDWLAVGGTALGGALVFLAALAALAKEGNSRVSLGDNLVFSAGHSEQYKHFLRMRVAEDGELTLYAIGLQDPGKGWDAVLDGGPPPAHTPPRYIWGTRFPAMTR